MKRYHAIAFLISQPLPDTLDIGHKRTGQKIDVQNLSTGCNRLCQTRSYRDFRDRDYEFIILRNIEEVRSNQSFVIFLNIVQHILFLKIY